MPIHALLGHLVIVTEPITALLALVYAWRPRARAGMRLPLVVFAVLNMLLAYWAGTAGTALLNKLKSAATAANQQLPATVMQHAHNDADALTLATLALLAAVLALVWWLLSPHRPAGAGTLVGAVILTLCVVAVLWFSTVTLLDGLRSVWAQHTLWRA
jgi:hypothetical protein